MSESAAATQKPTRRFPPLCWTREEALVLIEAYRERWYALHRAFLRTPDWDAVAERVTSTCPDVTPPKTSAQCRHKMEKLRQRHRVEKQRASAFGGDRFFSTWFYFEAMEAMENGSNNESGNNSAINSQIPIPNPTLNSSHQGLNPGRGIRFKPSIVQNLVTLASSTSQFTRSNPNFNSRVSNFMNNGANQDEDVCLVETPIEETSIPSAYRAKDLPKIQKDSSILPKPSISSLSRPSQPGRLGLRPRKLTKVVLDNEGNNDGDMWMKVPRNTNLFRGKCENEKNSNSNPRFEFGGKKRGANGGFAEVVSSIKVLGDGFMKMEKMKMDMAREIEKMRMEMEMKRNELILDSQKKIVEAFVNGLIENKKLQTTMTTDL